MSVNSLNRFLKLRNATIKARNMLLRRLWGVDLHPSASVSLSSRLRPGKPGSIVIGADTLVAFKTLIFTRDPLSGEDRPVRIGRRCFIGGGSTILPGVTIADESIVGAGAVVFEDVPTRTIVGGNPARIIQRGIEVGRFGRLSGADENARRLWKVD
jgi:maltose O-acetyltransferase